MRGCEQAAEVGVPLRALDEQRQVGAAVECDFRAGDRMYAEVLRRVCELERAVDAVVIGERERRITELGCPSCELFRLRGAVEERERRIRMQLSIVRIL